MEAAKEGTGLLEKILPPRLEDAGLEDCALPPDSIQEAFLKAADAVKSRAAAALFHASGNDEAEGGGCVADPWPAAAKETETDAVVGAETLSPGAPDTFVVGGANPGAAGGMCGGVKGGGELAEEEGGGDAVVVVVDGGEGGRICGDGMKEKRDTKDDGGGGGGEEKEEEKPILVEGVV